MKVHVIHGIHTEQDSPVKGLFPYLTALGFDVRYPEYGYELAVETKILNPVIEGVVQPYIEPVDVIIGHSNGCAIAYHLIHQGLVVKGCIFINAALEQEIKRPPTCGFIDVYYNAGDKITEIAKVIQELGIVDEVWGMLGHGGYLGMDPFITNIDCQKGDGLPVIEGHSDFFTPQKLRYWGPYLAERVRILTL